MTTEIAHKAPRGALAITDDQQAFTAAQVEALGLGQASRGEALVFLHTCQRTGLDPAARQIYAVWRMGKMTIQTGIDGYRLIADRTGLYAGNEVTGEGPVSNDGAPEWVDVTVRKIVGGQVVGFKARAYYREYVQRTKSGEPNSMWRNMPRNQLAKCAEALALRKAFPQDLSGVYTDDEMGQTHNTPTHTIAAPPVPAKATREPIINAQTGAEVPPPPGVDTDTGEIIDAEVVPDPADALDTIAAMVAVAGLDELRHLWKDYHADARWPDIEPLISDRRAQLEAAEPEVLL